jgi:hypothetical protein
MKAHDFDCLSLNQMEHFTESLNSSDVVVWRCTVKEDEIVMGCETKVH